MCDFEAGFIKAIEELFATVKVKCCLFHFTQNIWKNASPALTKVKHAVGEMSETYKKALTAKRRFMMLALLPEELITQDVLNLIVDDWKEAVPEGLEDTFDDFAQKVLRTYVGTTPSSNPPVRPRFPRHSGVLVG